jgi:hypothetical protein
MDVDGWLQPHLVQSQIENDNYGMIISVENPMQLFIKIKYILEYLIL